MLYTLTKIHTFLKIVSSKDPWFRLHNLILSTPKRLPK